MSAQFAMADTGQPGAVAAAADYGIWTHHRIPDDRTAWHPTVRRLYDYWLKVAPPGRLPGRQHIVPEDVVPLWSKLWMLDVFRDPLRYRLRLVGTDITRSLQREVTGLWLDEAQPETVSNVTLVNRYRFIAETGRPTWRRGPTLWRRDPTHRIIENCEVPLASDGKTVDKILAVSVIFNANGREL